MKKFMASAREYSPSGYVTFKAGTYVGVSANGLIDAGYLDGNQSLYVGPGNGSALHLERRLQGFQPRDG
ncbi:hypothetical protein [Archangium lipolyticum]|uniref:hypothetical protein n=1 Tax=Archangium lipolyticum TaxID=2970465 RepID=UPI00214B4C61|nr:hypothetical protein [Archangium lipolyticum]